MLLLINKDMLLLLCVVCDRIETSYIPNAV